MIYQGLVQFRNKLFDIGLRKIEKFNVPVISVGNITVGGTGKSPVTMALLNWALAEGLRPGVISRGYGRKSSGIKEVNLDFDNAAQEFGDEPLMIKQKFPTVPFVVGANRAAAGRLLLERYKVDFLIADDAFQHRKLGRDLDIVLIDSTNPQHLMGVLPFGRLREPLSELCRSDFLVLTKTNLANPQDLQSLKLKISEAAPGKPIVQCRYGLKNCYLHSDPIINLNSSLNPDDGVFIFCGLAQPDSFKKLISEKFKVLGHKYYPDHHLYSDSDLNDLIKKAQSLGAKDIITTAKDVVKIKSLIGRKVNIWVADLGIEFSENIGDLYDAIRKLAP